MTPNFSQIELWNVKFCVVLSCSTYSLYYGIGTNYCKWIKVLPAWPIYDKVACQPSPPGRGHYGGCLHLLLSVGFTKWWFFQFNNFFCIYWLEFFSKKLYKKFSYPKMKFIHETETKCLCFFFFISFSKSTEMLISPI